MICSWIPSQDYARFLSMQVLPLHSSQYLISLDSVSTSGLFYLLPTSHSEPGSWKPKEATSIFMFLLSYVELVSQYSWLGFSLQSVDSAVRWCLSFAWPLLKVHLCLGSYLVASYLPFFSLSWWYFCSRSSISKDGNLNDLRYSYNYYLCTCCTTHNCPSITNTPTFQQETKQNVSTSEHTTSSSKNYTTAQIKLVLIFCTQGLATIINYSSYSVVLRMEDVFSRAFQEYLDCEGPGNGQCDRNLFEAFDPTPTTFPLTTIAYVLLPISTLIYVANIEKQFTRCKTKFKSSTKSTRSSSWAWHNSTVTEQMYIVEYFNRQLHLS